jgi:RimJ/RimL family protein N-acetyltransferase
MLRKAGFVETGRIPEARVFNHQHYDDVVMTMTRSQFGTSQLVGKYGELPI